MMKMDGEYRAKASPELRLVQAVLLRGLQDAYSTKAEADLRQKEAQDWIFSGESEKHPFSFFWCCDQVGIDADTILTRIKNDNAEFREKILGCRGTVRSNTVPRKTGSADVVSGASLA